MKAGKLKDLISNKAQSNKHALLDSRIQKAHTSVISGFHFLRVASENDEFSISLRKSFMVDILKK